MTSSKPSAATPPPPQRELHKTRGWRQPRHRRPLATAKALLAGMLLASTAIAFALQRFVCGDDMSFGEHILTGAGAFFVAGAVVVGGTFAAVRAIFTPQAPLR